MPKGNKELSDLVDALQQLVVNRPHQTPVPHTDVIPKYIVDSIDSWDPAMADRVAIRDYFEVFDDFTTELTSRQRVTLLRMKLRGEAKSFLVEHPQLREMAQPYQEIKKAVINWFDREDLNTVLKKLMTARLGEAEGLREFAE